MYRLLQQYIQAQDHCVDHSSLKESFFVGAAYDNFFLRIRRDSRLIKNLQAGLAENVLGHFRIILNHGLKHVVGHLRII